MAKCGIKKYDRLPARVSWIDVDYLRWRLWRHNHPSKLENIPLIGPATELLFSPISSKQKIIEVLDEAVKIHNERKPSRLYKPANRKTGKR